MARTKKSGAVVAPLITARERYEALLPLRQPYLDRARECAAVTLPYLMPPQGSNGYTNLPTPFQSVGAEGVTSLAAKLLLALLPPGSSFFRLAMDDFVVQKLMENAGGGQDGEDARGVFEEALGRCERAVINRLEQTGARTTVYEALKHLVGLGNGLLVIQPTGKLRLYHLDRYVVKRDPGGNVLEVITKDTVARSTLTAEVEALLAQPASDDPTSLSEEKTVDVYTRVLRTQTNWVVTQEIEDKPIPDTEGEYPLEKCAYLPLRMTKIDGEDYGRGYAEQYLGDLTSLETLSKAIVEFSAVAAKILFLVNEAGVTDLNEVAEAVSGDFIQGDAKDITTLMLEKFYDFQVTMKSAEAIQTRLERAFMLHSAVQRNAERVTAEEVRYIAGELEQTLGGVYSILSQELQAPLANRVMAVMQREGALPTLPEDAVSPQIVTGLEALGRNSDLNKLDALVAGVSQLFGPEAVAEWINIGAYIKRRATALDTDSTGIVRTEQEVQASRQAAQQQQMMQQMAPKGLQFVSDRMKSAEQNAAQQQQEAPAEATPTQGE